MYHEKVKKPEEIPNILNMSSLQQNTAVKLLTQESYSVADPHSRDWPLDKCKNKS